MKTLNGHFDGKVVVLDETADLEPNTKVKVIVPSADENERAPVASVSADLIRKQLGRMREADLAPLSVFDSDCKCLWIFALVSLRARRLNSLHVEPTYFLSLRSLFWNQELHRPARPCRRGGRVVHGESRDEIARSGDPNAWVG